MGKGYTVIFVFQKNQMFLERLLFPINLKLLERLLLRDIPSIDQNGGVIERFGLCRKYANTKKFFGVSTLE